MKFTLGGVEELRDPRVRLLYAIDADGRVLGVTSWLPTWRDGASSAGRWTSCAIAPTVPTALWSS